MEENQMKILRLAQSHCVDGKELDLADICKLSAPMTMMEVLEIIPILAAEGYIEVIEIDMCCGADYIVTGITDKGSSFLSNS
ncbi:hypothetical protein [Anaerotignum sp. MB30-C6]|uniref:hypothetical protein n=1 Tax=Anaerotignum sp. MB30-C6 TaxID=3070814 RepID=UPI0027DE36E5|nr:hypothetical protein [Anaerotignum sp. MB30-C6]WMI82182.1 hypothetical protein RBQ60_05450 [Anaerotignum sp. MB30-C6]